MVFRSGQKFSTPCLVSIRDQVTRRAKTRWKPVFGGDNSNQIPTEPGQSKLRNQPLQCFEYLHPLYTIEAVLPYSRLSDQIKFTKYFSFINVIYC